MKVRTREVIIFDEKQKQCNENKNLNKIDIHKPISKKPFLVYFLAFLMISLYGSMLLWLIYSSVIEELGLQINIFWYIAAILILLGCFLFALHLLRKNIIKIDMYSTYIYANIDSDKNLIHHQKYFPLTDEIKDAISHKLLDSEYEKIYKLVNYRGNYVLGVALIAFSVYLLRYDDFFLFLMTISLLFGLLLKTIFATIIANIVYFTSLLSHTKKNKYTYFFLSMDYKTYFKKKGLDGKEYILLQ